MKIRSVIFGLFMTFALQAGAASNEIQVVVNGMVCSMCSRGISKNFESQAGDEVQSVNVNMDEKSVRVILKDGKDISDEKITKIISDAGVAVVKIERK